MLRERIAATSDFFERLLLGRDVLTERAEIEALVRYRYRGHSQGALVSALHKAFEAVDQSPLVLGEATGSLPSARPDGTVEPRGWFRAGDAQPTVERASSSALVASASNARFHLSRRRFLTGHHSSRASHQPDRPATLSDWGLVARGRRGARPRDRAAAAGPMQRNC